MSTRSEILEFYTARPGPKSIRLNSEVKIQTSYRKEKESCIPYIQARINLGPFTTGSGCRIFNTRTYKVILAFELRQILPDAKI
jgi:hypothetical protein